MLKLDEVSVFIVRVASLIAFEYNGAVYAFLEARNRTLYLGSIRRDQDITHIRSN